jgi:hypothetical protein
MKKVLIFFVIFVGGVCTERYLLSNPKYMQEFSKASKLVAGQISPHLK